ncbi:MAG: sialate O-acetylesterase, partial [Candidatus Scatosoma sp.]
AYAEDSEKTIDLYVIAGQSNAAGHTSNPSNTTFNSNVDYYAIAGTGATQQSTDFSKVAYGKGSRDANSFGPEIGIANAIATSGRTNAAVIYKYAIGGTYLYPVSGKDTWANALYDNWKTNLSIVVNHYTGLGYTVNLMGTFWMQGEADSEQEAYYNAYADNLTALINNMRSDYAALSVRNASAPFVIGKIAANYGNKETTTGVAAIRTAQDNVAKSLADKNVFAIETAKVAGTGGDNYHFGTEEMQDVGLRAGNTMIENNDFVMAYGASIRKTDPTGIRFSATISASKYAEITENGAYKDGYKAGMIIVPAQYFTDYKAQSDVTDYYAYFNTVKGKMIDLPFAADQIVSLDNGDYRINGAIVNIKEANFALDYQAVAYIAKTDENGTTTYEYSNVSESRNVKYVAQKAIESGELTSDEKQAIISAYKLVLGTLNKTELEFTKAGEETLTFSGYEGTQTLTWESSDENVVTVDQNGKVSAKAEGTASIILKDESGVSVAECNVTCRDPYKNTSTGVHEYDFATGNVTITGKGDNENNNGANYLIDNMAANFAVDFTISGVSFDNSNDNFVFRLVSTHGRGTSMNLYWWNTRGSIKVPSDLDDNGYWKEHRHDPGTSLSQMGNYINTNVGDVRNGTYKVHFERYIDTEAAKITYVWVITNASGVSTMKVYTDTLSEAYHNTAEQTKGVGFSVWSQGGSLTDSYTISDFAYTANYAVSSKLALSNLALEFLQAGEIALSHAETAETLVWSSTDENVATIENGKVIAKAIGTASIVAKNESGIVVAACNVWCRDPYSNVNQGTHTYDFATGEVFITGSNGGVNNDVAYFNLNNKGTGDKLDDNFA